jgi:hypothetical protein
VVASDAHKDATKSLLAVSLVPKHGALHERTAQDLARERQAIEKLLARTKGLLLCHSYNDKFVNAGSKSICIV